MRRFIFMSLFSILFLCSVAPKVRGYTLVQAASKTGPGVNVVSVSFPKATTAGNLIIVSAGWSNGGTASVSDSKLNTYSTAVGPPASGYASQIWYAANIVGGADTVTVSFNASYNDVVNIFEYSGLASSSPLDATGSNTGNSNSLNTGNITTTQANELIFATGFAVDQLTGGTNYTLEEQAVYGTNEYLGAEDRTGPAGSYQATFSDASSWNWVAQIATFKAAAVTPGTPTCGIHGDASIHVPTDWTTFGPPAKGQSYVDATFGCTVTRITDVSSEIWNPYPSVCNTTNTGCYIPIGHGYSTLSPFNANDTYLMLGDGEGFHFVTDLLGNIVVPGADMSNWTASNGMPQQFNDGWFLWDASDPNVFYYTNGSSMMKGTINGTCTPASTVCTSVVHDFSQDTPSYSAINFMDDADLSQDGAHVVIVAGDTTGTSPENVFVYNFLTNIKGPVYTTTTNPDNSQCVGSVNGPNNSCLHKLNQTADNNVLISFGYEPSTCGQNNPGTDTSGQ